MLLPADLGIVVVNHGHPDLLERNLLAIGRQASAGRVVVVDNCTGLAQREATTAVCRREGWLLIAPGLDLGFAAAVNAGVRLLRSRGCHRLLILSP
jgi:GT2 family glycosyltransferase